MNEASIFVSALDKTSTEERIAYLRDACGEDDGLRRRIEALLEAHEQRDDLLDAPWSNASSEIEPWAERVGARIGEYHLTELIGEGGFGLIFAAEQQSPVRREVALKVIKPGMDTRQVISRFQAERQALALMDHPHIARVYGAGETDTGRPYFVMELVRGVPITEYCDQQHLNMRERLELFITVCQAIQHAHYKGIIHRDIKPSNVLVTTQDGKPLAKVIDFGIAKAVHDLPVDHEIHTAANQLLGTPLYMSPEQAESSRLDVDTRTDIYSLGVVLYELLTGTTPIDRKRLSQATYEEVRRMIREEDPPKPSSRMGNSGTTAMFAAARSSELTRLPRLFRGDLDWITMKTLEKDRARRYASANGLARDIQRYLNNEPVEARPPSLLYQVRKFAARHRGVLATVTAVAILLVAGTTISLWQALRATKAHELAILAVEAKQLALEEQARARVQAEVQRQRAEESAQAAREAAEAEHVALQQAHKRLRQIESSHQIMTSIFSDINIRLVRQGNEPLEAVLAQRLVKAANQLEEDSVGDPLVVASLQADLGQSLLALGFPGDAIKLIEKARVTRANALGPNAPEVLSAMNRLAAALRAAGEIDRAIALFEETLQLRKTHLGENDPDTLGTMNNLAACYRHARRLDLALPLYEEVLARRVESPGREAPETLLSMNNLAECLGAMGETDRAISLLKETWTLRQSLLGILHPDTLTSQSNLGVALLESGHHAEAQPLLEDVLIRRREALGSEHPDTLTSWNNLGMVFKAKGATEESVSKLYEAAEGIKRRNFQHENAYGIVRNLVQGLEDMERFDHAESWRRAMTDMVEKRFGADSSALAAELANLAFNLTQQEKWAEAESVLRNCLAIRQRGQPDHWTTFNTSSMLGDSLLRQANALGVDNDSDWADNKQSMLVEAESLLLDGYLGMKQRSSQIPVQAKPRLSSAIQSLIDLYSTLGNQERVVEWQREIESVQGQSR